jgi:hypothetical protein
LLDNATAITNLLSTCVGVVIALFFCKAFIEEKPSHRSSRTFAPPTPTPVDIKHLQYLKRQEEQAKDDEREGINARKALKAQKTAATEAENTRAAKAVEARLRLERRLKDIAHQGELLVHARQVKQSRREGALNADFMTDSDKMYNSHLVHAIVEHRRTGTLLRGTTPLG